MLLYDRAGVLLRVPIRYCELVRVVLSSGSETGERWPIAMPIVNSLVVSDAAAPPSARRRAAGH